MPVVQHADGRFETDSTPIILALESTADPARTIFTQHPVLNFLSFLIEDFADEWLTKCLFHYRFNYDADREYGPRWVMDDAHPQASLAHLEALTETFLKRQTERMPIVGCTADNAPILEGSFHKLLEIMESFVGLERFVFGTRPSLADFGLFGQLKTLATDPTPQHVIRTKAPRVENWARRVDDLSGVDGEFTALEDLDESIRELSKFVANIYLPYLRANYDAFCAGKHDFGVSIFDRLFTQRVFKYHVKCFAKLQKYYNALSSTSRIRLQEHFAIEPWYFTTD